LGNQGPFFVLSCADNCFCHSLTGWNLDYAKENIRG